MLKNRKTQYCLILLLLVVIVSLTACAKQKEGPSVVEPKETTQGNTEPEYTGKMKEARDYLIQHGLDPLKVVTQVPEGDEIIVTWADLSNGEQAMLLNAFLDKAIQDISTSDSYGPVNLNKFTFILKEEKNAAEIYFYKEEIIGGVTYPKEEIAQQKKNYHSLNGETLAQIRHIDYSMWQAGQESSKPQIYYLQAKQAYQDGFERVTQIQTLDPGRLLITFKNDTESRVYLFDTQDASDFYTGISLAEDHTSIRTKRLMDNRIAVFLWDKMLIVEPKSFKITKELKYPDGEEINIFDLDISPDGHMIVCGVRKGLMAYDGQFKNGKVIVESKIGKDPHGMDWEMPRYPIFSPDGSRIMYRQVGYEWLVGTGIIAPDGTNHQYFEADENETTYIQWYDNQHIYSSGPAYGEFSNPTILDVENGKKTLLVQDTPKDQRIEYFLANESQLYYQKIQIDQDSYPAFGEFGFYDIIKNAWHPLIESPGFPHTEFYSMAYDTVNQTFSFIMHNQPFPSKPAILIGLE